MLECQTWNGHPPSHWAHRCLSQESKSIHGLPLECPRPGWITIGATWDSGRYPFLEWDGMGWDEALGFTPETLPVGNPILFPAFPWQTWVSRDRRGGSRASNSIKTGISLRKSTLPVQFSCQEDSVGFQWVNSGWSIRKKPTPSHFFSLNSHIQLRLCLLQIQAGAVERIPCGFRLSRELAGICSGSPVPALSAIMPKAL